MVVWLWGDVFILLNWGCYHQEPGVRVGWSIHKDNNDIDNGRRRFMFVAQRDWRALHNA